MSDNISKSEIAKELFLQGFNCAQAVVGAFCDEMELDMDTALKIASPFGGGMGRMREVCGAVSGMFIVLGYYYGNDDPKDTSRKKEIYERVQELASQFRSDNGSIICRDLLALSSKKTTDNNDSIRAASVDPSTAYAPTPEKRTATYYKKRPCPELVAYAAGILDDYLKNNPD